MRNERLGNELDSVLRSPLDRRTLLKRSAALGIAFPTIGALLAACTNPEDGEDDESDNQTDDTSGDEVADEADDDEADESGDGSGSEGQEGGRLIIGLDLEPDNIDPHVTPYAVSHTVMMNIFDPLVWRNEDGDFVAGLATSWETSDDGTVVTFELRDDVTFHDGTEFNAEAVQFNFDRISDPETESGFAATLLGPYDHAEIVDDYTVEVHFDGAYAPFLDGASQAFLGMVSPDAVEEHGPDFGRNPVGTGFMRFESWQEQESIVLVRNEDYTWAPEIFDTSRGPLLESVEFRFFTDGATRLAALESGDVHVIDQVPHDSFERLQDEENFDVLPAIAPGLPVTMFMNSQRAPTDELEVRQALLMAVNRDAIVDVVYFGATEPAYGPLYETTPYYNPEVEELTVYDPEEAAQILEDAGWTEGEDGIREKDGEPLALTWAVTDWSAPWAELVQAHLRDVGVDAQIEQVTEAVATEMNQEGELNLSATSWVSSDPVIMSNLFHSKNIGTFNSSRVDNARLDELLDSGERTVDEDERAEIYDEAQTILLEEAMIIPLVGFSQNSGMSSSVQNLRQDFRNYYWIYDASLSE